MNLDLLKNLGLKPLDENSELFLNLQTVDVTNAESRGTNDLAEDIVEIREAASSKSDDQFEFKKFRNRREYTQEEQMILLTHFKHNHFPPARTLKLIADRLQITHRSGFGN